MGPTNNGNSVYINLDETSGDFNFTLQLKEKNIYTFLCSAWTTKSLSIRLMFGVAAHMNKFKNVILCLIDLSTTLFWAYFFKTWFTYVSWWTKNSTDIAIFFTKIKEHLL